MNPVLEMLLTLFVAFLIFCGLMGLIAWAFAKGGSK